MTWIHATATVMSEDFGGTLEDWLLYLEGRSG